MVAGEACGCLDERVNRFARRDVDGCRAHVESGVLHHLCRGVGVLWVEAASTTCFPAMTRRAIA
jgi:hypothetical protein